MWASLLTSMGRNSDTSHLFFHLAFVKGLPGVTWARSWATVVSKAGPVSTLFEESAWEPQSQYERVFISQPVIQWLSLRCQALGIW